MESNHIWDAVSPFAPNILWIILILAFTRIAIGSISRILRIIYSHFNIPRGYYLKVRVIVRLSIFFLSFFLILLFIPGVDEKIIALVGIGIGVIISLSSTSTIGNSVAGLILHYNRPIREGDRVEIDGIIGDVVSMELSFIHIKTIKDVIVSIPCLHVLNNKIINYSPLERMIVPVSLTLGYDLDPGLVEKLLLNAISKVDGIESDPSPFVLIKALNDYTVEYEVNGYTVHMNQTIVLKSKIMRNIIMEFSREKVQIMSPAYIGIMEDSCKVMPKKVSREISEINVDVEKTGEKLLEAKKKLEAKRRNQLNMKGSDER